MNYSPEFPIETPTVNKYLSRVSGELLTAAEFLRPCRGMKTKTRNWLIAIFILSCPFVLFLGCLIFMAEEPLPPLAPIPSPNAYGDLVTAAKMIKGDVWDYGNTNLEKLRGMVLTNAEALALARIALTNPCAVPLEVFTEAYDTNRLQDRIGFSSLGRAFVCEGKLSEKENHFGDAVKSYLDAVRFGNQAAHGGLLVDELIGAVAWSMGETELKGILTNLDAPTCRNAAATLETLAAGRQTWAVTMQQQEAWSRRIYGWRSEWFKLIYFPARQRQLTQRKDTLDQIQQQENRLLVELAARAYQLDKGKTLARVADLVPEYLKAIPQDPVTGTNIVYSP